ncbi:zinc import ATP-binding protein ZnuC [Abditibacteriota bacterium]|nr:zinc import ATP-binding protein ZnuC [Abditibacteriota bacterium]
MTGTQQPAGSGSQVQIGETLLEFREVSLGYTSRLILSGLNFSIQAGDYAAIVGANGAGKTTLLRAVLGQLRPTSGTIRQSRALRFGYVPQARALDETFPITALEVALMGRYARVGIAKRPTSADVDAARQALLDVGAGHFTDRLFRELSGGQKQRALIARALAAEPDVLVLDEHTAGLDIASERGISELVDRLQRERGLTVMMVSHELTSVANHAERIGLIHDGSCEFLPAAEVLESGHLERVLGVPLRVVEVEGRRVVL